MIRRLITGVIVTALGVAALVGCQSSTDEKKQVTLKIKAPAIRLTPDFDSEVQTSYDFLVKAADAFAEQYDAADVTVDVVQFEPTDQTTEIDDCFDTENAADVFYADFFNSETYVHTGRVVPLDDIISDAVRDDIDDTFWNMCMQDGRTYLMPYLYRQNVLGFNKDLFRACGLDKYCDAGKGVQTWSMDEWSYILDTLKEKLPASTYPLMMYAGSNQGDTHIMSYIRSQGSSFFDENGRFSINTPEGIAGLEWIKELQDGGYFPPNAAELEIADNNDMFVNGQLAIYVINDATESIYDFECGFVNFPSIDGGISTNFNTGFEVFDNGDEDKLAAAKAFVKYIYESDWIDYSSASHRPRCRAARLRE